MKRTLIALATSAVAVATLAGCGSEDARHDTAKPSAATSATTASTPSAAATTDASTGTFDATDGGHVIEVGDLEDQVEQQIAKGTGETVTAVCIDDLTGPVGNSTTCSLTTSDGEMTVDAVVTELIPHGLKYDLKQHEAP